MSTRTILSIHLDADDADCTVQLLGQPLNVLRRGCGGDPERARALIHAHDGHVDAIGLQGMPALLQLGPASVPHAAGSTLAGEAKQTPVVDGGSIRASLERWGIRLADRAQPGIFSHGSVLMTPGLNHGGMIQGLEAHAAAVHFADPFIYFGLPYLPGVGSGATLARVARTQVERLKTAPFRRIYPRPGEAGRERTPVPFLVADILAGDIGAIRRYAPNSLKHKLIVVDHADEEDIEDLRQRGAATVITLMPSLDPGSDLGRWPASAIEAALAALRPRPGMPLAEDTYLDMLAEMQWTPGIRFLQPEDKGINRFAFVIHPLNMGFIHRHPVFGFTRYFPDRIVEEISAWMPPMYISRITGGVSPATGQRIEGHLISLGSTPRMMMRHKPEFTYSRLNRAARMAEKRGARIMGLGAFTSVVGDAGITVAREADIAITSGNSLTVAATLEAAKIAVTMMGHADLAQGKAMVVGATGSIASVCARLLAQAIKDVVLVSIEPEKLIELKRLIQQETPGARVTIATRTGDLVADCDLIITATSAFGQRVIDLTKCKPGAVICDVARPPDVNPAEAALRPDLLVIESGEVIVSGDVEYGYNIGLPPKTAYACLAETALLAMDGRFEDYTLGRNIGMERVKEIWRLFRKHQFKIAPLRSFGQFISEADVARKRTLAEELRNDPARFTQVKAEAAAKLATIPVMAKGVPATQRRGREWGRIAKALNTLAAALAVPRRTGGD